MQKYIRRPLILALALISSAVYGQKCGHDHLEEEVKRLYPNYESAEQEFIQSIDFDATHDPEATVFKIPVVVHIIYDDAGDNISDKQVKDAIAVINEDFRRLNADTVDTRSAF
jgi:hypothetical protein